MAIFVLYIDLNKDEVKSYKTRHASIVTQLKRGRLPRQLSSNGAIHIVQSPENLEAFSDRIVRNSILYPDKDRLAIVDMRSSKIFIWGNFEQDIKMKFPFIFLGPEGE